MDGQSVPRDRIIDAEYAAQELQDRFGFVVLRYTDAEDLEVDDKAGIVNGGTVNSSSISDDAIMRIIGEATAQDWEIQCIACGDDPQDPWEAPAIAYRKVRAE